VIEVLLLSERQVRDLIGPAEALPAVRDAFIRLARGEAILPGVIHLDVPESGAEVHVKGAHLHGSRFFTIKVASGSYANPDRGLPVGSGLVLVFDAMTGFPRAVLFDNGYLTDLRTGAAGALAADLLARRDTDRVGIIGVGTQARHQLAALLGVRKPERVIAFGRSEAKATAFAVEMEKLHGIHALPAKTVEQAVRGSDVVITVTPSREPLVRAEWVLPGTHITAVGADGPDKRELEVEVLQKADKVVADRLDQCVRFGEIHHAVEAGVLRPEDVYAELGEIAAGRKPGRTSDREITVADLTGVGVQDAAVAELVVDAATRRGVGKALEI
jgi:ornithine cyclodeaminase